MRNRGPYKDQTLHLLRERGVPVETVLDVGVLFGTPELTKVWPDKKHILFEPVAEFTDRISANYRNISHELHCVAVGNADGTVGLKLASQVAGVAISHSVMFSGATDSDARIREVRKISLDSFLADRGLAEPYLLKIDIDGQDLQVLKGATETLKKCSIVIIECQSSQLVQNIAAVQNAGFTLFDLAEPCYYDKVFWQCDAVFIRKEIAKEKFKQLQGTVEPGMYEKFS